MPGSILKKTVQAFVLLLCNLVAINSRAQIAFKPYQTYITGSRAVSLVMADLNDDSLDDIALATGWTSTGIYNYRLLIYYQNPEGTLSNPLILTYPESWYDGARSIDAGDLNHDKKKDLVIVHNDSISVFYQANPDSFTRVGYYSGPNTDGLRCGDLNYDGLDDIAVTHFNAMFMNVFYQDSLAKLDKVSYPSPEGGTVRLEIFDLNSDSLNDLVYLSRSGYTSGLYFFLQNEDGGLDLPFSYNTGLMFMKGLASGHLNQDDRIDIAITAGGNYPAQLAVLLKSIPNYQFDPPKILTAYDIPEPVAIHDLNCDSRNEIVAAHSGWGALSVFEQDADNQYGDYTLIGNTYGNFSQYCIGIGDLNGDMLPDIALASENLIIHYNNSKPAISDTVFYRRIMYNDTTNVNWIDVVQYVDSSDSFLRLITDSISIHRSTHIMDGWDYGYGLQEGQICGHFVKDSVLLDSAYVFDEIMLSADTILISRTIDTLVSGMPGDQYKYDIEVYPNPSRGSFTIEIKGDPVITDIYIYDINGVPASVSIRITGTGRYTCDIRDRPQGMYILEFKKNNRLVTRRKILIN